MYKLGYLSKKKTTVEVNYTKNAGTELEHDQDHTAIMTIVVKMEDDPEHSAYSKILAKRAEWIINTLNKAEINENSLKVLKSYEQALSEIINTGILSSNAELLTILIKANLIEIKRVPQIKQINF